MGPPGRRASRRSRPRWRPGRCRSPYARTICTWTDKLPEDCRPDADAILVAAAGAGMDLRDLAALAAEIYARSLPDDPDEDKDEAFEDRSVRAGDHVRGRRASWPAI